MLITASDNPCLQTVYESVEPRCSFVVKLMMTAPAQTGVPGPWLPLANTYGALWEGSNLPAPPYDLQIASPNATVDAP